MKQSRNSSFELLRIVAMLLVLLGHYIPVRIQPDFEMAQQTPFSCIFELELNSITFVCVNVFVLISGYFSIRPKRNSLFKFIIQIIFWSYFTTLVAALLWPDTFSLSSNALNVIVVFRQWFVFCYLGLYMFAPILNSYIDSRTPAQLLRMVAIYYAFSIFFGYICYGIWGSPKDFLEGMSILSLIGLYLIGAYLRKVSHSESRILNQSPMFYMIAFIILTFIQSSFAFILLRYDVKSSPFGYLNPVILLESVCLFMAFAKIKMRANRCINYLASSAFAAYLLHCSPALGPYFTKSFIWIEANFAPSLPIALIYLTGIYFVAVFIDKLWWIVYRWLIDFLKLGKHRRTQSN